MDSYQAVLSILEADAPAEQDIVEALAWTRRK